jgi:hypothetical protein
LTFREQIEALPLDHNVFVAHIRVNLSFQRESVKTTFMRPSS